MTKKKTSTTKPKAKKSSAPAPKKAASKAKTAKAVKAAPSKTKASKAPASKAKKTATKSARASKAPKKTKPAPSSRAATPDDGEKKVREIANQTSPEPTEEKMETKGFSMEDVRSILSTRDDESTADPEENDPSSGKKGQGKESSAKKGKTSKVKKVQTASIKDILGLAPSTVPTRPIRDEKKVPKQWLSYYNDLMSLRTSLKGALGERSNETLGASARESSGELSLNSSDAGTETFNRDVALSMVASEQEALVEIEDAIDRIFDGTYGICQETDKPIKKTRLKVVPFTRFSLEGQNLYEQRRRREGNPVTGVFATISDSTMGQED